MTTKHRILGIIIVLFSLSAQSHTVIYQDGFGIMSFNSQKMNELLLGYSMTPRFAIAYNYLRDSKSEFHVPRLNFLLKRWNERDSQGNIYLSAGSGLERFNLQNTSTHLGEVAMDWESRKYYTAFSHLYLKRDQLGNLSLPQSDYNHTKVRLGFAPFLADFEDLNIWFITQFDRHNGENQIEATQFLRFFRKNVLWEIGADFNGSMAFNFMIHL